MRACAAWEKVIGHYGLRPSSDVRRGLQALGQLVELEPTLHRYLALVTAEQRHPEVADCATWMLVLASEPECRAPSGAPASSVPFPVVEPVSLVGAGTVRNRPPNRDSHDRTPYWLFDKKKRKAPEQNTPDRSRG